MYQFWADQINYHPLNSQKEWKKINKIILRKKVYFTVHVTLFDSILDKCEFYATTNMNYFWKYQKNLLGKPLENEKNLGAYWPSFRRLRIFLKDQALLLFPCHFWSDTARKASIFGIIHVRIFTHLDWIRRDTEYPSVFSPNAGKYGPEKTQYLDTFHALFMHSWNILLN